MNLFNQECLRWNYKKDSRSNQIKGKYSNILTQARSKACFKIHRLIKPLEMIEIEIYEASLTDALTETKSLAITQRESSLSYKLISWLYFQHLGVINELESENLTWCF